VGRVFKTAGKYYVAGRYAAFTGFIPVTGNLLHADRWHELLREPCADVILDRIEPLTGNIDATRAMGARKQRS
jgi:hypothetical protein